MLHLKGVTYCASLDSNKSGLGVSHIVCISALALFFVQLVLQLVRLLALVMCRACEATQKFEVSRPETRQHPRFAKAEHIGFGH